MEYISIDTLWVLVAAVLVMLMQAGFAMLEAGFRKPMKSIPIDSPESAVTALLRVFSKEELLSALT